MPFIRAPEFVALNAFMMDYRHGSPTIKAELELYRKRENQEFEYSLQGNPEQKRLLIEGMTLHEKHIVHVLSKMYPHNVFPWGANQSNCLATTWDEFRTAVEEEMQEVEGWWIESLRDEKPFFRCLKEAINKAVRSEDPDIYFYDENTRYVDDEALILGRVVCFKIGEYEAVFEYADEDENVDDEKNV